MDISVFKIQKWENKRIGSKWPKMLTSDLYIGATMVIFTVMNNFLAWIEIHKYFLKKKMKSKKRKKNTINEYDISTHLVRKLNEMYLEKLSSHQLSQVIYF